MRMLKVFIAYNATDKIVSAKQHRSDSQQTYFCLSCDNSLIWRNNALNEPWFSHELSATTIERLRGCTYYDPEVKSNERLAKLRNMAQTLAPVVSTSYWHCHLCGETHTGKKYCQRCHTNIYCRSIQPEA